MRILVYFWGILLGFQNFGPGGIFSVFFVEIPVGPCDGLCQGYVAGRGVLNGRLSDSPCFFFIFPDSGSFLLGSLQNLSRL